MNSVKVIDHNNHFNFFRLLFALQVVYSHSSEWLKIHEGGGMIDSFIHLFPGVPLFFLVSGFLVTDSYLNSQNLKEYFIKRGLRIYPALFINILILEFAMYIGGNINSGISVFQYIGYFIGYVLTAAIGIAGVIVGLKAGTDIYNYTGFFQTYPSGVLWTLTVELTFYLVLPFLLSIKNIKLRNIILLGLFFASMIIPAIADENFYTASKINKLLEIIVLPYLWIFIIGMVMRLYWVEIKKYFIGYGVYYFAFYLLYCVVVGYFGDGLGNYKRGLELTTVIQIILLAFAMFSFAFSYTHIKINRKLDLSYSTYLYHMLIVQILISLNIMGSGYLYLVVIGATFIIAYLSWTYIEKPMLNLKKVRKIQ